MIPSKKGYSLMINKIDVEGVVFQENDQFMNQVNSLDFNVDVTPQELILEYEKRHGEILLNNEDLQVPLYGDFNFNSDKNIMDLILNYRNKIVAERIQNSKYDKIIVMYGADHRKGIVEELQKLDANWKEIKKNKSKK
jgi:pheromone shutdown protein TraB